MLTFEVDGAGGGWMRRSVLLQSISASRVLIYSCLPSPRPSRSRISLSSTIWHCSASSASLERSDRAIRPRRSSSRSMNFYEADDRALQRRRAPLAGGESNASSFDPGKIPGFDQGVDRSAKRLINLIRSLSEARARDVCELIVANVSVRASQTKIPVCKGTVEYEQQQRSIDCAMLLGCVIYSMIAELAARDAAGNDSAEVVLRAAFLQSDAL